MADPKEALESAREALEANVKAHGVVVDLVRRMFARLPVSNGHFESHDDAARKARSALATLARLLAGAEIQWMDTETGNVRLGQSEPPESLKVANGGHYRPVLVLKSPEENDA